MLSVLRAVSLRLTDNNNFKNIYRFFLETTMESHEIDNVKAEKDLAIRKSRRERKFKWFLEACAVLFLLAHSSAYWLPIAGEFSGDLLREIVSVFRSHLFVFALFNAIIVAVYALSGKIHISNDAGSEQPDLYDEFVTNSESVRRIPAVNDSPPPETCPAEEKTVSSENADASTPVENRNDAKRNPKKPEVSDCDCTNNEKALVKSYERTQSVRFERKRMDQSQREFRRSYTDVYRKLTSCGEEEAKKSRKVNQLSNEEFNRTIEAFIAAQKWIQREEYKEERKTERYMALTVCQ
ncbi:hypothetical protein L484_021937 [Morus notabilis]|uniref:DUF4408 domain-containing protein n=1 Tax=Morus notabilis TaxID=981085 RepID=W9SC28_9ROSA|nr:uncharacterized protein LOC21404774 [Morus notabilis]EXC25065.1 hypothetical protein L484_021937 [Morus notabilis]